MPMLGIQSLSLGVTPQAAKPAVVPIHTTTPGNLVL